MLILALLAALIIGIHLAVQIPRHVEGLRARQAAGEPPAARPQTAATAGEWSRHLAKMLPLALGLPIWLVGTFLPYLYRHDIIGALEGRGWDGQVSSEDPGLGGYSGMLADLAGGIWVVIWLGALIACFLAWRRRTNRT